jgi:hypothetical protein
MAYGGMIADEPLNGYVCFYNGLRIEVYAQSTFGAKLKAENIFKAPRSKRHMISVVLAAKNGQVVEQSPASL